MPPLRVEVGCRGSLKEGLRRSLALIGRQIEHTSFVAFTPQSLTLHVLQSAVIVQTVYCLACLLDNRRIVLRFSAGPRGFSLLQSVQTGLGGSASLLSNAYSELFLWGRCVNLTVIDARVGVNATVRPVSFTVVVTCRIRLY